MNHTVKTLIEELSQFNPDAEVCVNVNGERIAITGIFSWSAYPGEEYTNPRDIKKEKSLTRRVTLASEASALSEE